MGRNTFLVLLLLVSAVSARGQDESGFRCPQWLAPWFYPASSSSIQSHTLSVLAYYGDSWTPQSVLLLRLQERQINVGAIRLRWVLSKLLRQSDIEARGGGSEIEYRITDFGRDTRRRTPPPRATDPWIVPWWSPQPVPVPVPVPRPQRRS
jgi:hypothetical protein